MSNMNVFISVGVTSNEIQETFVSAIENRLRGENLIPNTVGRNKFSADSPLKAVIELMDECYGTIIVALERTYFPNGTERRNSKKEQSLSEIKYSTCWNQIEAAIAYSKGQPILIILEEGIKSEGLLEKGYDWYVMNVKPEISALSSVEFNGVLSSWKKKVEDFANHKATKQLSEKKIDTTSLTIGDLLKGLKPSHLWTILIAIVSLVTGSFTLGKYFETVEPQKSNPINMEMQNKIEQDIKVRIISFFESQKWLSSNPSIVISEAKSIVRKLKKDPNTCSNIEQEIERRKQEDNNWTFANQLIEALALVNYLGLDGNSKNKNDIFLNMPLPEIPNNYQNKHSRNLY